MSDVPSLILCCLLNLLNIFLLLIPNFSLNLLLLFHFIFHFRCISIHTRFFLLPFARARARVCVYVYLPSFRCLVLCVLSNENVRTIYRAFKYLLFAKMWHPRIRWSNISLCYLHDLSSGSGFANAKQHRNLVCLI